MSMDTASPEAAQSGYRIITDAADLPPAETGVLFNFVDFEGSVVARSDNTRPLGFEQSQYSEGHDMVWLGSDAKGEPARHTMPVAALKGVTYLGADQITGEPVVAFRYYKQEKGEEAAARILRLTGVAYGVQDGHRGVPERRIPAEKPGWYMLGEQVGQVQDGQVTWQEPAERTFPFARIIGGPIGDPRSEAFRKLMGIY